MGGVVGTTGGVQMFVGFDLSGRSKREASLAKDLSNVFAEPTCRDMMFAAQRRADLYRPGTLGGRPRARHESAAIASHANDVGGRGPRGGPKLPCYPRQKNVPCASPFLHHRIKRPFATEMFLFACAKQNNGGIRGVARISVSLSHHVCRFVQLRVFFFKLVEGLRLVWNCHFGDTFFPSY